MTDKPSKSKDPWQIAEERFCEEHGGAVRRSPNFLMIEDASPHQEYPYHLFEKIIKPWQPDRMKGSRHWGPMALAVDHFVFLSKLEKESSEELYPAEVRELLRDIQNTSKHLAGVLSQLQRHGFQPHDRAAPLRSEHLCWLDAFVSQAAAGNFKDKVDEDPRQLARNQIGHRDFGKRLELIQLAAQEAQNRVDDDLLRRKPGPRTSAITMFVHTVAPLWENLTGKKARAYRVRSNTYDKAPFVHFVGQLAGIAGEPAPSWQQVLNALEVLPSDKPNLSGD